MELNLKKEALQYYEVVSEPAFSFETTQEAIVPDSCADVARVVDTTGIVLIQSREMGLEGRMEIAGTVKAEVLFVPDGAGGASTLHLTMPFRTNCDGKGLEGCSHCGLQASLKSLDARLLNPRKLLLRADISLEPTGYRAQTVELCTGVTDGEGVQTLEEEGSCALLLEVMEKEMPFTEELQIPASRKGVRELLSGRAMLAPTEWKIIGKKLVVRGVVTANVLYRSQADELCAATQEYAFSQIMETRVDEDAGDVRTAFELVDCSFTPGSEQQPDDGYTITMNLQLRTVAEVYEKRPIRCLTDLYSLSGTVKLDTRSVTMSEEPESFTRKYTLREVLQTGVEVKQVVCGDISCGPAVCRWENGQATVQAPALLHALYSDDNGALLSAQREVILSADLDVKEDMAVRVRAECGGEVQCGVTQEGIELRFPVVFRVEAVRRRSRLCLQSAQWEEEQEDAHYPSVVLRRMVDGMRLWDMAKMHHSTCGDILAANGLEREEDIPRDRLLLVPRKR